MISDKKKKNCMRLYIALSCSRRLTKHCCFFLLKKEIKTFAADVANGTRYLAPIVPCYIDCYENKASRKVNE